MSEQNTNRPELNTNLTSKTFLSFYYLKEELENFCRENNLSTSGGKIELTKRISCFLDSGKVLPKSTSSRKSKVIPKDFVITLSSVIENDFVCTETHRAFFTQQIGKSFSFNVAFQKWLKTNSDKTYNDAVLAYYKILEDKKHSKTKIDSQFEYNTYIRDFFEANKGKTLQDAIKCWKHKKSLQGHNKYEMSDLIALNNGSKHE